jgi:proteasome accessory factor A
VILIGAGTLNSDGTYELSERAASINCVVDRLNFADRCLIWLGHIGDKAIKTFMGDFDIAKQLRRTGRMQLGCSEANMCQRAQYLKLATTCLVLDMIESGFLRDAPQLVDPVAAIKSVSKDLSQKRSTSNITR